MSDRMRWRYGDTNPVMADVDAATVIEVGDLVYQDVDDAKPASTICLSQEEARAFDVHAEGINLMLQERFADKFLGVAMQRSREGEIDPIRVATTGVFEFDCPVSTFELGDLVGADYKPTNMTGAGHMHGCACERGPLTNQRVCKVSISKYAIGRVAKRNASAFTTLLVDIRSTVMTGGVKGSSPSRV